MVCLKYLKVDTFINDMDVPTLLFYLHFCRKYSYSIFQVLSPDKILFKGTLPFFEAISSI